MVCAFPCHRNFSVKDAERLDRPQTVDTDKITTLMDSNPHNQRNPKNSCMHGSVVAYLKDASYMSRMDVCVAQTEQPAAAFECMLQCDLLLEKNKEYPFLKKMIRGDKS